MTEIFSLVTTSPENFRGGSIWNVILGINGALQAIGYALLVLFFVTGVMKVSGSFVEMKRPELAFKMFIRFALSKAAITYSLTIVTTIFQIVQTAINAIMSASGLSQANAMTLPEELVTAIEDVGLISSIPLAGVALLGSALIWVLSIVMVLTVYSRFFKLFMATAIAPIPLSAFAGEPSSSIGRSFLKSYAAICMEGCIVILACVIFSSFATTAPEINADLAPATIVWNYVGGVLFNMLVLVGTIKMSSQLVRELIGL